MQLKALALLGLSLGPATVLGDTTPAAVHEVKMSLEGKTYRFEPAELTIQSGDEVAFTVVSGGPHNVAFDTTGVAPDVRQQLSANMPDQISPLAGPLIVTPGTKYTISFAKIKPGTYSFFCMPHMALGMKGTITVK